MDLKKPTLIFAALFGFFIFWGGTHLFKMKKTAPYSSDELFTYIMPKLSQYVPKFSLFDRTFIDKRKKLAPKASDSAHDTKAQQAKNNLPPNPAVAAKGKPANSPTQNNNPSGASSAKADPRGSSTDRVNGDDSHAGTPLVGVNSGYQEPLQPNPKGPEETTTVDAQVNDWKSRILSNPTREVMNEFVYEFEMENITRDVFYRVMDELVNERDAEIHALTLYGLSDVPTYDTLSFLLKHKDAYFTQPSMYQTVLSQYEKEDKLKLLTMALNSGDSSVVLGVMPIISKVGSQLTAWSSDSNPSPEDERAQRGPAHRRPKGEIILIIKMLGSLQDSKNHQIAFAARETLKEINYHPPASSGFELSSTVDSNSF